jgi:hypothetical protein
MIAYDSPACEGNPYVEVSPLSSGLLWLFGQDREGILYWAEDQVTPSVTLYSRWNFFGSTCVEISNPSAQDAYAAVPLVDASIYQKPYKLIVLPAGQ